MKKYLAVVLVILSSWYVWQPIPVAAHYLMTDGTMGVLIHLDPDDDPIAGESATFYLDFKDKSSQFLLEDCNCTVTITKGDTSVLQTTMEGQKGLSYLQKYTFPAKGVYQLQITGKPKKANTFKAFKVTYDIRVSRQSAALATETTNATTQNNANKKSPTILIALWVVLGIAVATAVYTAWRRTAKTKK